MGAAFFIGGELGVEPVSMVLEACVYGVEACIYGVGACVYSVGACVYGNPMILVSAQVPLGLIGFLNF